MKNAALIALLGATAAFTCSQASAVCFTVGGTAASEDYEAYWVQGVEPSPFDENTSFKVNFNNEGDQVEGYFGLGKFQWEWSGEGPGSVKIEWPLDFDFALSAIWIKSGSVQSGGGAWYAMDIADFNTADFGCIQLFNPDPQHGISHFTLIGSSTNVPDSASTLALLALGLGSIGLIARRRRT